MYRISTTIRCSGILKVNKRWLFSWQYDYIKSKHSSVLIISSRFFPPLENQNKKQNYIMHSSFRRKIINDLWRGTRADRDTTPGKFTSSKYSDGVAYKKCLPNLGKLQVTLGGFFFLNRIASEHLSSKLLSSPLRNFVQFFFGRNSQIISQGFLRALFKWNLHAARYKIPRTVLQIENILY